MSGVEPLELAKVASIAAAPTPSSTVLFDTLTPLWPYLEAYERRSIRGCSREGLRIHDTLVTVVSVHDLWGRVLPQTPQEIGAGLSRMIARGCCPAALVLRLRCGTASARHARGLAVLSALERRPCNGGCGRATSKGGWLSSVRLEGLPLTGRVVRALTAAAPGLTSLKLYGYDLSQRSSVAVAAPHQQQRSPHSSQRPTCTVQQRSQQPPHSQAPDGAANLVACRLAAPQPGLPPGQPPGDARPGVAEGTSSNGGMSGATAEVGSRGVPALLARLAPNLTEVTFQDCHFGSGSMTGWGAGNGSVDNGDSGDVSSRSVSSGEQDSSVLVDTGAVGRGRGGGDACRRAPGAAVAVSAPLVSALHACGQLRHLGLRHHGLCPFLACFLTVSPATQSSCNGVSAVAAGCSGSNTCGASGAGAAAAGGDSSLTCLPGPPLSLLATLTALTSLKLQTQLPCDRRFLGPDKTEGGGALPLLAAALAQLTCLTRLELGSRTAVRSVSEVLAPVSARRLRDLDIGTAQVSVPYDLAALAGLTALTRLAVGAILAEGTLRLAPAAGVLATAGGVAGSSGDGMHAAQGMATAGTLPLPPQLIELSVAAPLAPATLLALRRPASLRVLRTTGFALGPADVDAASLEGCVGRKGFAGGAEPAARPGDSPPVAMLPAACDNLAGAVRLLLGRFVYRDLGIELHIGFQNTESSSTEWPASPTAATAAVSEREGAPVRRRQYLAAPAERPAGHWTWASQLVPLGLQGLELAGLELREEDVTRIARQLPSLEDLRLDCRYPLACLPHLAGLRRLRRLLLNASFWHLAQAPQPQAEAQSPPQPPQSRPRSDLHSRTLQAQPQQNHQAHGPQAPQLRGPDFGGSSPDSERQLELLARAAAVPLQRLCRDAPECLYDLALASNGRAPARLVAMWAVVRVEQELPRVGCGAVRVWVCP